MRRLPNRTDVNDRSGLTPIIDTRSDFDHTVFVVLVAAGLTT